MRADPILQAEGVKPPGVAGAPKELGNVIWKLCSETYPDVVTISLANNGFRSLGPVSQLPVYFPNLQNLSLEGNELKWTKDLDTYASRKHKLTNLKELLLTGNPVYASAIAAGNEEGYRREVLSRFRQLTLLDQKPVTPTESGFANLPSTTKSKKVDADAAQVPLRNFPVFQQAWLCRRRSRCHHAQLSLQILQPLRHRPIAASRGLRSLGAILLLCQC